MKRRTFFRRTAGALVAAVCGSMVRPVVRWKSKLWVSPGMTDGRTFTYVINSGDLVGIAQSDIPKGAYGWIHTGQRHHG